MNFNPESSLRILLAAVIPPVLGTLTVFLGAMVFREYGVVLFLLLPVVMGFAATVIYDPEGGQGFIRCFGVSLLSIVVIGVFLVIFAIEGLICLAMATPLAIPLMAVGVTIGWAITSSSRSPKVGTGLSVIIFLTMPLLMGFETSTRSQPTVHEVLSTVEVEAPIDVVWKNVVAFPQIDEPPTGILRFGFAYPVNAHIDGKGVGAIRYCNFNTGPFVEPITEWEEPNVLAFDVKEQPMPMTELTPYEHIEAAHLGYFRSQKGRFTLYEKDGKTVIEGRTYYAHDIAPDFYWKLYSDEIIHRIHMRVLNHIKTVAEREAGNGSL